MAIIDVPPTPQAARLQQVAVYACASSAEHRKHLGNHAECVAAFGAARGWRVTQVVKDCGSRVTEPRPQVLALLSDTSISHIVVEHTDRCSRFALAHIQTFNEVRGPGDRE
jgi:predicted site-specific integrase-resolvase